MSYYLDPEVTLKTAQNAVDAVIPPTGDPHADTNPARVDSRGRIPAEQKFDKRVYGGISYLAQAGTGIMLTNWLKHGGGRTHFEKIAEWLGPNFMSMVSKKKGAAAIEEATGTIIVTTMIMVGNTFLLPVKWLENRKSEYVRSINATDNARREAKGEVISPEERESQEYHLKLLENSPKQNWWSLGIGRAFALGAVYATLWGIGNKNNERMEEGTFKVVKKTLEGIGLKKLARYKPIENYTRIAFYDLFYSAVSAGGLYVYSHLISPPDKRGSHGTPQAAVLPPLEEAVLEELDPKEYPAPAMPRNTAAAGWKQTQQPALPLHPQQNLTRIDSVTPSQAMPQEVMQS